MNITPQSLRSDFPRLRDRQSSLPLVMGILNVTPDSFSDGGRYKDADAALRAAEAMVEAGADIIDVGRVNPAGAQPVSAREEIDRVLPVIRAIRRELDVALSIDTRKADVMQAATGEGVDLINDVMALRDPGALEAARDSGAWICLMHMQGEPRTMQADPHYEYVVRDVRTFLEARIDVCVEAGISRDRLIVDPGFGFGKKLAHNLSLLKHLRNIAAIRLPVMVGISRKSMIGALSDGVPAEQRLPGSLAAATLAAWLGAAIIRVHDVPETVQALRLCAAVQLAD